MKKQDKTPQVNEPQANYGSHKGAEETLSMFPETDKILRELREMFISEWEEVLEMLVSGNLIKILNDRGIEMHRTMIHAKGKYQGSNFEFDIIAVDRETIVIVEVKTTLRPNDVKKFVAKLKNAKIWMPEFNDKTVIGAMAYIKVTGGSRIMAINKGLFAIRATGNSASIVNDSSFEPRKF